MGKAIHHNTRRIEGPPALCREVEKSAVSASIHILSEYHLIFRILSN